MRGSDHGIVGYLMSLVLLAAVALAARDADAVDFDIKPGAMGLSVDSSGTVWVSYYHADCVIGFREDQILNDQNVFVVPRCENPRYIAVGPLGAKGYAASWDRHHDGDVVVFDLTTGEIDDVLTGGPDDCHFNAAVAPDEAWLCFANYYAGTVTKMALPGGAHLATIGVGSCPACAALTPDGSHLYVIYNHAAGSGEDLKVIDMSTNSPVFDVTLAPGMHDMKFSSDGTRLYVTAPGVPVGSGGEGTYVYVFDASDPAAPTVIDTIDIGGQSYGLAVCDSVAAVGMVDGRICFVNLRCGDNSIIGYDESGSGVPGDHPILYYGDIHDGRAYFANYDESVVHIVDVPPCGVVEPYSEPFDPDPEWLTNNPSHYYVADGMLFGYGESDSWEYCTTPLSSHPGTFVLEWDSYCDRSDWSSGAAFGLFGCGRLISGNADQYLHLTYNHDDGGYFISLHVCDSSGQSIQSFSQYYDFIDRWMHNTLTYDAATGMASCSVGDGGQPVATFEITGLSGFDESLCQLGLSVCHDYAVGGQVTSLYIDNVSFGDWSTGVDGTELPRTPSSSRSFPNPFNPSTSLAFELAVGGRVQISVYDSSGRFVRSLVDERLQAGVHRSTWDGMNGEGRPVGSGVYFCRIEAPGLQEQHKIVLVR